MRLGRSSGSDGRGHRCIDVQKAVPLEIVPELSGNRSSIEVQGLLNVLRAAKTRNYAGHHRTAQRKLQGGRPQGNPKAIAVRLDSPHALNDPGRARYRNE